MFVLYLEKRALHMYHIYIGCKTPVKLHLFAQDGPLRLVLFIFKKFKIF